MSLNVLIADDSAVMRNIISRTLHMLGIPLGVVYTAKDGGECLELLSREWVDLLFLDINMPVLDGYQVLKALSADPVLNDTPIIVVSAESNRFRITELGTRSVKAFIGKPFTPESFRDAVQTAIGGITEK